MNPNKWRGWVAILVIFVVSVLVRYPLLDRPLSYHHEWLTSTVLRHLEIWSQDGLKVHHFSPPCTYSDGANSFINNQGNELMSARGCFYYISYPPLAYLLAYAWMTVLHLKITVLNLQILNLLFHGLNLILIWLLGKEILKRQSGANLDWALAGVVVYAFCPATLWFHGNVYMADMVVQTFFILTVWLALRDWDRPQFTGWMMLGASVFAMCYTEWLGVLVAGCLGVAYLVLRPRQWGVGVVVLGMASVVALGLMAWQYSLIAGWDAYLYALSAKFLYRSGATSHWDLHAWLKIGTFYGANYLPFLIGLAVAVMLLFRRLVWTFEAKLTLFLTLAPVILHHVLLFNFTSVHDFSTLKFCVPLSVVAVMLGAVSPRPRVFVAGLLGLAVLGMGQFWGINGRWEDPYGPVAKVIRAQPKNTVIAVQNRSYCVNPQLIYQAKRNVVTYRSKDQIRALMRLNQVNHARIISVDAQGKIAGPEVELTF